MQRLRGVALCHLFNSNSSFFTGGKRLIFPHSRKKHVLRFFLKIWSVTASYEVFLFWKWRELDVDSTVSKRRRKGEQKITIKEEFKLLSTIFEGDGNIFLKRNTISISLWHRPDVNCSVMTALFMPSGDRKPFFLAFWLVNDLTTDAASVCWESCQKSWRTKQHLAQSMMAQKQPLNLLFPWRKRNFVLKPVGERGNTSSNLERRLPVYRWEKCGVALNILRKGQINGDKIGFLARR